MSDQRLALVVTVDHYDNPGLRELASPAADAEALADVLGDPDLGDFDLEVLRNPTSWTVYEKVEGLLADRRPSDLVLLHFSCHGLKDLGGELFLAATNTVPDRLASTGIDAAWISRVMQRSRAQRVVLLLDCCYGGAFERGVLARADGGIDVGDQFRPGQLGEGRGRVVITSSTAMEYAFEGSHLSDGAPPGPSVFTDALVEGIRSGEADRDQDGFVALDELYDYVYERVRQGFPQQTPCKWEFGLRGDLYVARNPHRRVAPAPLPQDLLDLLDHPTPAARLAAVNELARLAAGTNLARAAAARLALGQLADDDSRRVSSAAGEALQHTAVHLAVSTVDFGLVPRGAPRRVVEVRVEGPPLALASSVATPAARLRAGLEGNVLRITWVPGPGRLDEVVTLAGPAGEAHLRVTGGLLEEQRAASPPPQKVLPAAPPPARAGGIVGASKLPRPQRPVDSPGPIAEAPAPTAKAELPATAGAGLPAAAGDGSLPPTAREGGDALTREDARPDRSGPAGAVAATAGDRLLAFRQRYVSPGAPRRKRAMQALVAALVVAALTPVWVRALDRDGGPGQQGGAVPTSAPATASASGPRTALPTALPTPQKSPQSTGKPVPNGTITVGKEPGGLAVSPDSRTVYVANMRSGEVSFVDVAARRVANHVHLPTPPRYVAVSPNGRRLYVSVYKDDYSHSAVAVIDVRTKKIIKTIPTGQRPYALAVAPNGRVWVPIHDASRMEVIDDKSLTVVAKVIVPKNPHGVAFSPDGAVAYTPDHESGKVSIIDTRTAKPVAAIDVGKDPHALAVSPDGKTIFVANYTLDMVKRIDVQTRQINATIEVQDEPQSIAFAKSGSHAYVVNEESGSVSTLETAGGRVTDTQRVGRSPRNMAVAPDGRFAYVTLGGADKLWVGKMPG